MHSGTLSSYVVFFFHFAASSHRRCLQQLFLRKCRSDRVVLLGFLAAMAPKKTATKAAAKPVRRLTTKGKPTADEQAKQVRRKNQANMVTQVKNAHDKLLTVQKGEIAVSEKEQEDLQVKAEGPFLFVRCLTGGLCQNRLYRTLWSRACCPEVETFCQGFT